MSEPIGNKPHLTTQEDGNAATPGKSQASLCQARITRISTLIRPKGEKGTSKRPIVSLSDGTITKLSIAQSTKVLIEATHGAIMSCMTKEGNMRLRYLGSAPQSRSLVKATLSKEPGRGSNQ